MTVGPSPTPRSTTSRRQVLRMLGTGGAVVLVAGVGTGGYRVYDTAALQPGHGHAYDPWRQWDSAPGPLGAVAAAVLAANPHNTQPWLFEVGDTAIDVFVDPTRHLGSVDPFRREQHVGLGCALENLAPATPQRDARYEAIGSRHTNRGPYLTEPLGAATLAALVDPAGLRGIEVHWITNPTSMATLGTLLVDAAQAVVDDDRQSHDGFAWFRGDDDAVQAHRDGLTLDAQGLGPLVLGAAKVLPMSTRSAGDAFWVKQTREVHTATAAAYGVVTATSPDDRATQLRTGRLLQRIHLTATSLGVALQHLNQITERIDAERVVGRPATFAPRFAELLPPGARPLVAFRVGRPERAARPSPRRLVSSVAHDVPG
jgi:hypothetical protein